MSALAYVLIAAGLGAGGFAAWYLELLFSRHTWALIALVVLIIIIIMLCRFFYVIWLVTREDMI